jgi:hypothetical protein
MAGELKYTALNTVSIQTADRRLAQAFCDGRTGQVAGSNTNPHVSGSEVHTAYEAGFATTTPEGLIDNCALAIPISVPNIVGLSSAAAQAAILAANLTVGKITLTTGNVTIQSPVATTKVQPKSVVLFTLTS